MRQITVSEASPDKFKINERYLNAISRQSYESRRSLELSIIEKGQLTPVDVSKDMTILDGHTRFEILSERNMNVKYIVVETDDEIGHVIDVNIIRRQLTNFEKVELLYNFIIAEREKNKDRLKIGMFDVLTCVKDGHDTVQKISKHMKYTEAYAHRLLKQLTDEYYLSRKDVRFKTKTKGLALQHIYSLMPKADEFMTKFKDVRLQKPVNISKYIGLSNTSINNAVYLIENASDTLKSSLRKGNIGISGAYNQMFERSKTWSKEKHWRNNDKIQCPHCNHIAEKREYIKVH